MPAIDDQSDWQCSRCTFLNQAHINKCQICSFSKAQSAALSQQSAANGNEAANDLFVEPQEMMIDPLAEWQCAMCATLNSHKQMHCNACTYSKEKSVSSYLNMQQEKAQIQAAIAASTKTTKTTKTEEKEEKEEKDEQKKEEQKEKKKIKKKIKIKKKKKKLQRMRK